MISRLGRYEVLGELGQGAMGVVYKAKDPLIDRVVAIKTINLGLAQEEKEEYEGDKDEIEELLPKKISQNEIFSSLTKTQLDLFKTIYQIQKQTNTNKVSLRSVAKIHYPEKDYSSVRSTISDYLTILSAWGLIKKQRVGKESFVAVSDHGLDLVSESNIKQKKKKLRKQDFVAAMNTLKVADKQQQNIFTKMQKALPQWEQQIDISFLSADFKEAYKAIIRERATRLR